MTKEELLATPVADGCPLDDGDLTNLAAREAAKCLAMNWADAVGDGTPIEDVVHDVDDVICILKSWKEAVLKKHGKSAEVKEEK